MASGAAHSPHRQMSASGIFSKRFLIIGVAAEILLLALIVYSTCGHPIFKTSPISPSVWLFIIPFAFGMVCLEELRKWVVRCLARRTRDQTAASFIMLITSGEATLGIVRFEEQFGSPFVSPLTSLRSVPAWPVPSQLAKPHAPNVHR